MGPTSHNSATPFDQSTFYFIFFPFFSWVQFSLLFFLSSSGFGLQFLFFIFLFYLLLSLGSGFWVFFFFFLLLFLLLLLLLSLGSVFSSFFSFFFIGRVSLYPCLCSLLLLFSIISDQGLGELGLIWIFWWW